MNIIPWELVKSKKPASMYGGVIDHKLINMKYKVLLREMALCKLVSPYILSVDYRENTYVFQPELSVVFESIQKLEYFGIFTRGYGIDKRFKQPVVCLRKGEWELSKDKLADRESCKENNLDIYDQNMTVMNKFVERKLSEPFFGLLAQFGDIFANGIKLDSSQKSKITALKIHVETWKEECKYNLSFIPDSKTNEALEKLLLQLKDLIIQSDQEEHLQTDTGVTISYRESITDWENDFVKWKDI